MTAPRVDVVIASYNHAPYLRQAIDSVLASDVPLHVWVVDDGSTDGSREMLDALDDPRVTVAMNPDNIGAGATFNRGFAMGQAPFVAICNSDDMWRPEKLSRQLTAIGDSPTRDKIAFTLAEHTGPVAHEIERHQRDKHQVDGEGQHRHPGAREIGRAHV